MDAESNFRNIPPVTSWDVSCSPDTFCSLFHIGINDAFGSEGGAESNPSVSPNKNMQCVIPGISLPILTIKSSPDKIPNNFGGLQSTTSPKVIGTTPSELFSIGDKSPEKPAPTSLAQSEGGKLWHSIL